MSNLKITIISNQHSWLNDYIEDFIDEMKGFRIQWIHNTEYMKSGDIAFFLGFEEIVGRDILDKHKNNLVVHESDLPKGKGMSPMTWQVLEGQNEITISLFEMTDELDSGDIYLQDVINFNGTELLDEIRSKQAQYTFSLCNSFIRGYPTIIRVKKKQNGKSSFYCSRDPEDSMLDVNKTIVEQFNLLRVVDNERYPAFFKHKGEKYLLKIFKQ